MVVSNIYVVLVFGIPMNINTINCVQSRLTNNIVCIMYISVYNKSLIIAMIVN